MTLDEARRVADAVLWEGYVLYPYRKSNGKNAVRWQFGVVMPKALAALTSEPWKQQTECLVEATESTTVDVTLRFLQVQARIAEAADPDAAGGFGPVESLDVDGREHLTFDEAVEREVTHRSIPLSALLEGEREMPIGVPSGRDVETLEDASGAVVGRFVRRRWNLFGVLRLSAERTARFIKVRVVVENLTDWDGPGRPERAEALRRSFVGAHTMLNVAGDAGTEPAFVSLLDPPDDARDAAQSCVNLNTWPVLVGVKGRRDVMLSSPIILYDYPETAPESAGDLFDATEIDEILLLRVLTLTDEEKAEARATDARAREIIDRADNMPPEMFEKLHGAIRYLEQAGGEAPDGAEASDEGSAVPRGPGAHTPGSAGLRMGWGEVPEATEPTPRQGPSTGADGALDAVPVFTEPTQDDGAQPVVHASQGQPIDFDDAFREYFGEPSQGPPDIGTIRIADVDVGKGSHVRLRPKRRADAHDIFLNGRCGRVAGVFEDVDGQVYVAVTLEDDPSGELDESYGRYYYFDAGEVEPVDA